MRTSFPALIWLLAACGGETAPTSPVLPGDDEVVAVVEGGPISRYDLDRTVEETLGPLGRGLDEEGADARSRAWSPREPSRGEPSRSSRKTCCWRWTAKSSATASVC